MAAKKKYVPGRALARLAQSKNDKSLVNYDHLLPIRIGLELAFDDLLYGKLRRDGWDLVCECFNFGYYASKNIFKAESLTMKAGQDALKSINHRAVSRGSWTATSTEIAAVRLAIKEYHVLVLSVSYAEFRTVLSFMEANK